ncbi:hypothetical protein [Xenorhabdus sp. KJ12.1]|uniref:hypothetical protein n=1 Tax=Xenorhabdus sp. KJ12.1 TaxID=1851571 RepID=UPI000C057225|nr:hypothetical protein [Xenorhabdus sp. KJ12.1]PHM67986.1 membrane protein [Xenorhabdus sp. KJ12.1]
MDILKKTLGGLNRSYLFRNLFFGIGISVLTIWMGSQSTKGIPIGIIMISMINAFLYPYARFVYEQIIAFIMGENVFFINVIVMLFAKIITMILCWGFSIFIAPIGLAYLYFYHTKQEKIQE